MTTFDKFIGRLPKPSWGYLLYWLLLFGATTLFMLLAWRIRAQQDILFDRTILAWLDTLRNPNLTRFALFLDVAGNIYALAPLSVILTLWFWRLRRRAAVFFVLAILGAVSFNQITKLFFARARPEFFEPLAHASNFAFPSGHTMASTAFALALTLVIYRERRTLFPVVAPLAVFFALLVGFSRSYLQVHYPTDMLAGWALSSLWVLGLYDWYRRAYPA